VSELQAKAVTMGDNRPQNDISPEIPRLLMERESPRGRPLSDDPRHIDALRQMPAATAFSHGDNDYAAVAVLEHIYRDMIAALQQMYRDTIAAKDDSLAGRDRELETKDALIEHLKKRAEDAEARASQALRYIGELDENQIRHPSNGTPADSEPGRGALARLFGR
jgi:hypothetical protein